MGNNKEKSIEGVFAKNEKSENQTPITIKLKGKCKHFIKKKKILFIQIGQFGKYTSEEARFGLEFNPVGLRLTLSLSSTHFLFLSPFFSLNSTFC